MSEYSRRNLACSSHHKCPEGWRNWTGHVNGYTSRPFCDQPVGHAGDHTANIESIEATTPTKIEHYGIGGKFLGTWDELTEAHEIMRWPNTLGIPRWLLGTTMHGLAMVHDHLYERDQTECESFDLTIGPILTLLDGWPVTGFDTFDEGEDEDG